MSEVAEQTELVPSEATDLSGGTPVVEDELDPLSVIDNDLSHPFMETDETGVLEEEEEEESEEGAETAEEAETNPEASESPKMEAPEEGATESKFTLDGVEYENTQIQSAIQTQTSLVEVEAGLKERGIENLTEAIRIAETYSGLERKMSDPVTAREVIEEMIQVATGVWGEQFEVPASVDSLGIDPSNLTESERGLLAINARLNQQIAAQNLEYTQNRNELRAKLDEMEAQYKTDYSTIVKAAVPASTATSDDIRRMMSETGINDPVKAFKVATFDKPQVETKAPVATKKPVAVAAKSVKTKTYDSMAPGMTADKIDWYDANGYTDVQDLVVKK